MGPCTALQSHVTHSWLPLLQAGLVPPHGHRVPDLQLACPHTELTGHPLQLPRCAELCRAAGGALGSPFPPSSVSWEAEWGGQQSRLAPSLHPASGNQNLFLAPVRDPQQQTQPQPEHGSAWSTAAPGAGGEETTTGLAGTESQYCQWLQCHSGL